MPVQKCAVMHVSHVFLLPIKCPAFAPFEYGAFIICPEAVNAEYRRAHLLSTICGRNRHAHKWAHTLIIEPLQEAAALKLRKHLYTVFQRTTLSTLVSMKCKSPRYFLARLHFAHSLPLVAKRTVRLHQSINQRI